jgi:hypothetical protein
MEVPKATLFNACIETAESTAAFRDAWKYRRYLIPADGYLEWTTSAVDGKKGCGCCGCLVARASASLASGPATTPWA